MSINQLHEACDQAAAELDAVLREIEPFETTTRGGDMYALVSLARTSLVKAAALSRSFDEEPLSDGVAGLMQMTTAALTGEAAADGLEFAAIGQIVSMVHTGRPVAS